MMLNNHFRYCIKLEKAYINEKKSKHICIPALLPQDC